MKWYDKLLLVAVILIGLCGAAQAVRPLLHVWSNNPSVPLGWSWIFPRSGRGIYGSYSTGIGYIPYQGYSAAFAHLSTNSINVRSHVGIGTSSPQFPVDITGNQTANASTQLHISTNNTNDGLALTTTSASASFISSGAYSDGVHFITGPNNTSGVSALSFVPPNGFRFQTYTGVLAGKAAIFTDAFRIRPPNSASAGIVQIYGTSTACPACSSAYRGGICYTQGSTGNHDTTKICRKLASGAYTWFQIYSTTL